MKNDILTLWDIDKTTIMGLGAHLEAFSFALKNIYGVEDAPTAEHHGFTDKAIIYDILKGHGFDEKRIESKFPICVEKMVNYFKENIDKYEIVAMPGVKNVLEKIEEKNILKGLVTGNLEQIARSKLEKVGLNHYFKFGAFGNESIERSDLVKLAIERARNYGFNGDSKNVYLFDDTPTGIRAGKAANVKAIGVATGDFSKERLKKAGAYYILENLENIGKVLEILKI